ncbi:hypothetical protein BD626DRAFT_629689 [Schizophyllum amplum]|uniref:Uncharacterized protein n=1 Tax=Schizophyllum amplum TaxID=97359 RepID=A0A550CGI6_9AGAR|nr:hypothetical protein BD626DRAFT_629689 [Auriculariopsis ampla]
MAKKQRHPNGQHEITIDDVQGVYNHQYPIPLRCYSFKKPRPQSLVTPKQVTKAYKKWEAERNADATPSQPQHPLQQIVRLHPNGRRLAAIRDVNKVYAHQRPIPMTCYPVTNPAPDTMVTPEQVTEAVARYDAQLSTQPDVDRVADVLRDKTSQVLQVPPLQTQPQQASPPLARASSPRTERLHPNGQRLIAIRDVVQVYDHERAIPVSCYPFDEPRPETMVAPEQVVAASDQFAAEMFDQYNADRTADATDATSPQSPPQAQRSAAASESADAVESAAVAEPATAAEPAAASEPAVLESQALQIQQVHPNGQQLIAIRDVQQVYELQQPIPMSYYPFKEPQPHTMVTPAQVLAASARYDPEPTPTGSTPPQETQQPQPPPIQPLRLHPNGQRTIAIRDVDEVYDFDRWDHIDMEFFPRWSRPQTQITPEQLAKAARAADLHERALQAVHNIDTAFGLIPEGGLWENMYDD